MKIDDKIDEMFALRETKRGLDAQSKAIGKKIDECQEWLLTRYKEVGTTTSRGQFASATVTEAVVPNIVDWGAVSEWIMENDGVYLVHRRVSAGPWKELLDAGTKIPGIEAYTKTTISLRKLKD